LNSEFRTPIDAPTFLYECFYVNGVNARKAAQRFQEEHRISQRRPGLLEFARHCIREGFSHIISNNLYVGTNPSTGHRDLVRRLHDPEVETYLRRNALYDIRMRDKDLMSHEMSSFPTATQRASRRHLHIIHGWGGGLMRWVSSFCRNDAEHVNMVLKPTGPTGEPGSRLYLYASINEPGPIAQWDLPVPIKATVRCNPAYRRIINSIVKDYGIDVVFVSTLIGHSMDVLKTKATTVLVCHDHFPLTPEIHIGACDLSGNRITDFSVDKVFDRGPISPFTNYSRSEAKVAHKAFREILARRIIKLVTPSPSARRIYLDLAPELDSRDITVIPNGTAESILSAPLVPYESNGKLRIVIPGRLSVAK